MSADTGVLHGRFPYVRVGHGEHPVLVLPGLTLDNRVPGRTVARSYAWAFRGLAEGRTLTVLQRPHGLATGGADVGTADIADLYAAVLREQPGPVDVVALSTGGLIGQHLALRHPALVRRLVLVVSGSHLAAPGRQLCTRWLGLAREEQWGDVRGELAAAAVDGRAVQWLARRLGGSGRPPDPVDAADFTATTTADLRHDTRDDLGGLTAPTLVVGGRDDPFFPEPVLRSTAAAIPGASVEVHAGGHGVPKHHARWLQAQIGAFLDPRAVRA